MCIFSIFALCGCGKVDYSIIVDTSGKNTTVTMQLNLNFYADELNNGLNSAGTTLDDFRSKVQSYANAFYLSATNRFVEDLGKLPKDDDDKIETYNGTATVDQIKNYVLSNIEFSNSLGTWVPKNSIISAKIYIKFNTYNAYRYFNGTFPATEDETDESIIEERVDKLFYVEDKTYQDSVFNDILNNSIAKYFLEYFNDYFTVDDMNYTFTYSTPSSKLYSDANEVYEDENGNYVHVWKFDNENLKQDGKSKVCTYTVKVRAYVWYVLALLISVLTGICLFFIIKIRENKTKKLLMAEKQKFEETSKYIREVNGKELNNIDINTDNDK